MNQDKARELFSAYYEGALETGLKQSLERQLRDDANLQADYAAFSETISQLDELRHETIELPTFLRDRIATRVEQVQSKPKFGFPLWTNWMRGVAVAGLGVAAIIGALPLMHAKGPSTSGLTPGAAPSDQLTFRVDGSKVTLLYEPTGSKTVVISSPLNGKEIQRFDLDGQRLMSPIENSLAGPAIFKIEVIGDKTSTLLAIPGTQMPKAKVSDGSIQEMALALAAHYRVPVEIEAADVTRHVNWNFSSTDARTAAHQSVATDGFSVDQRADGLIEILDR